MNNNSDSFIKIKKINEGAYGKIYLCQTVKELKRVKTFSFDTDDDDCPKARSYIVLKKFRALKSTSGMDVDTIREMRYLPYLQHENIIKKVYSHSVKEPKNQKENKFKSIQIVMDFMVPLTDVIWNLEHNQLEEEDYKLLLKQILRGLEYLHSQTIYHRDIKPANILLDRQGIVKITDFGLSRESKILMTKNICTLNYRAPELLFESSSYSEKIDIWSAGCTFAELFLKRNFFGGDNSLKVLQNMVNVLGNPSPSNWQDYEGLPKVINFEKRVPQAISKVIPNISVAGAKIIERMLTYDPNIRPSASELLADSYFKSSFETTSAKLQQFASLQNQLKLNQYLGK